MKDSLYLYKRLFPLVAPYWKRFVLASLSTVPLSLCTAGITYLMKPAIDDMFLKQDMRMLTLIPLGIVLLYLVRGSFEFCYHYLMGYTGTRIMTDVRNMLYFHLQTLSLSFFIKNTTGRLMTRVTNDVTLLQRALNKGVIDTFKALMTIIGLVSVLIVQDLRLACISLLILPWVLIPILRFGKKSRKISTRNQEKMGKISTFVHETITGSRIVKAFCMEEYENRRFSTENMRLLKLKLKRLKIRSLSGPTMEMIGALAGAAVIFYGGYSVINGSKTPGEFFSFLAALLLLYGPTREISTAFQDIQEGLAAAKRVFEVLDTRPDISEPKNARPLPRIRGRVTFDSVKFAYNGSPVLKGITLETRPGESVAIVGTTGSGKTTLVNLIPRFYDVSSGSIRIDGQDIRETTLASLRSQIALVSQNPYIFNDTVHSNIAYGGPGQSRERVVEAARYAWAHEFIEAMPEGYDSILGEQGRKLSGGQRQRIAIARAILKDAPILILDEATAALDSQVEKQIQQSLARLIAQRTTFIISHRLSTIVNADRIIVLEGGKIVESGSHDELFRSNGQYTRLYSIYLEDERKQTKSRPA